MRTTPILWIAVAALAVVAACGSTSEPVAVRLVDLFQLPMVTGTPVVDPPTRTEVHFSNDGSPHGS